MPDDFDLDCPPDPDLPPEPPEPDEPQTEEASPALAVAPSSSAPRAAPAPPPAEPDAAPAPEPAGAPSPSSTSSMELLDFGPERGSYRLVRQLGEGGMAQVFLAKHLGAAGFERTVALKRILPECASKDQFRKMFLEEARLAANLRHRNIAAVEALLEKEDSYYLVLEFIPGRTLRDVIAIAQQKAETFGEAFSCYVVAELADALHYAHAAKDGSGRPLAIVHRDVTPHNVMISESGEVKLLDFGIAASDMEGRERTQTGMLKGKVMYMSPEHALGDIRLDGRADLFSLGIILAELLTGRRVFEDVSEGRTFARVQAANPADVETAVRNLPTELQEIIHKLLASDREQRYATGGEVARALRKYLASKSLYAGADERSSRRSRVSKRSPTRRRKRAPRPRLLEPGRGRARLPRPRPLRPTRPLREKSSGERSQSPRPRRRSSPCRFLRWRVRLHRRRPNRAGR